jgi:hypothetical protein
MEVIANRIRRIGITTTTTNIKMKNNKKNLAH